MVFKFFSICTLMSLMLVDAVNVDGAGPTWPPLYQSYTRAFLDNQIRVIDRDSGDRTTSEGQAYAMFFALVANDRSRFDGLLRWAELNLAAGDLTAQLPAWLWGHDSNDRWGVLDGNAAADADVWMAYVLLEAGRAWNDQRYTAIGRSLAKRIANEEVADIGGIGPVLMPAPKGFRQDDAIRLNASYLPLQVFVVLGHLSHGPWERIAQRIPTLVSASAPHGFATDWVDFAPGRGFSASDTGSYDAIRVYLVPARSTRPHPDEMRYCVRSRGWPIGFGRTRSSRKGEARWQRRGAERARWFLRRAASLSFRDRREETRRRAVRPPALSARFEDRPVWQATQVLRSESRSVRAWVDRTPILVRLERDAQDVVEKLTAIVHAPSCKRLQPAAANAPASRG